MATKTFEELKQLAIQIRDEKTNKQNTATRVGTAMLEHINKLEQDYYDKIQTDEELKERDDKLTELSDNVGLYNVDKNVPLGSGFYTSTTARAAVPSSIRKLGLIITYKTDATTSVTEQFIGSDVSGWATDTNWKNVGSECGNKILDWNTDVASTRKQVPLKERKAGIQISYTPDGVNWTNEQYIGTSFTDTEFIKDSNWHNMNMLLLDIDWSVTNKAINSTSRIDSAINGYDSTDFIDISNAGIIYFIGNFPKGWNSIIAFYDIDKNYMPDDGLKATEDYTTTEYSGYINKPSGVCYMRLTCERKRASSYKLYFVPSISSSALFLDYYNSSKGSGVFDTKLLNDGSKLNIKLDWIEGEYFGLNGKIAKHKNYCRTDFLPCCSNDILYIDIKNKPRGSSFNIISFFDKDKNYISGIAGDLETGDLHEFIDIPSNARYMTFTTNKDYESWVNDFTIYLYFYGSMKQIQDDVLSKKYPSIVFPKYIDSVIGRECNIFYENLELDINNVPISINPNDNYGAEVQLRGNIIQHKATTNNRIINIGFFDKVSGNIQFRSIEKGNGDGSEINVLLIGDSNMTDARVSEIFRLLEEDGDYVIKQIGIRGTSCKHEGRSGWSYKIYATLKEYNTTKNPFFNLSTNQLDIANYMSENGFDKIDYIIIDLGTNDIGSLRTSVIDAAELDTIIGYIETFINGFIEACPNCKIGICLPPLGCTYYNKSNIRPYLFRENMFLLNKKIVDKFDDGAYNENVTCVDLATSIHYTHYPNNMENLSSRIEDKIPVYTDWVHYNDTAKLETADRMYSKIRAWMNNLL